MHKAFACDCFSMGTNEKGIVEENDSLQPNAEPPAISESETKNTEVTRDDCEKRQSLKKLQKVQKMRQQQFAKVPTFSLCVLLDCLIL